MTRVRQGLLLIDNSAYSRLADPDAMRRLKSNMRAAWLDPAASEVNLLEASATTPPAVEAALVATIYEFAGDWPLLAWPFALLRRIGQALVDDIANLRTGESGKEWYLEDAAARHELRAEIAAFNKNLERHYAELHAKTRPKSQQWLKARRVKRSIGELRTFLDEEWPTLDLRNFIAEITWASFGLPGEAPVKDLLDVPAWRILLDIEGAALFARALVHEQPKLVQRSDLIQLVYLGASGVRLLAAADGPFLSMARQIINGRYAGARVLHIDELLQ